MSPSFLFNPLYSVQILFLNTIWNKKKKVPVLGPSLNVFIISPQLFVWQLFGLAFLHAQLEIAYCISAMPAFDMHS